MPLTLNWRREGANAGAGDAAENCGNAHPDAPLGVEYAPRDRRGWVRVSEITLSGVGSGSGRGRARGGMHSDANAHASGCAAMPQSEISRTGSREWNNPQRGRSLQWEGTRAAGERTVTRMRAQPGP
jgi:hypothetical protein